MAEDAENAGDSAIGAEALRALQQRSDARGLRRFAGHLAFIAVSGGLYAAVVARGVHPVLTVLAALPYGFSLVTMFAAMHESIHRTAFKSRWLNDGVGWLAGLLSFYNSTFYRYYHGWHHRFTQLRGRDPELDDPKPTSFATYILELSAFYWWVGKLQTYAAIARGKVDGYGFLNADTRPLVVRSVRLQLLVYAAGIGFSFAVGKPLFVTFWLLPVALGQPLLRAILLAEHTGCSEDSDPLTNTRTTYTVAPVRFLMWEMPYHAEHHRHPALPFFALAPAHALLGPRLAHVARDGYVGVHAALLKQLARRRARGADAA